MNYNFQNVRSCLGWFLTANGLAIWSKRAKAEQLPEYKVPAGLIFNRESPISFI
ncbi:hypothetical protein FC85_GL001699 [Lentilactobacillus diolivorans DSM 14421]|uniref:Uncharacterized protein n=1 Tax=Lentilactobacillus diolivorans DSM 14421 TaxID=1423739 RepID=A0A0R1S1F1_9LACO|nr:hypothetical protein FC85_GL001699 [Lentilactobacillus diolivorans DSM 14421]